MALMTAGVRTFPCSVESGDPASIAAAITTIKRQNIYNILGEYLLELQIREVMIQFYSGARPLCYSTKS